MIKANELRIGNFILSNGYGENIIEDVDLDFFHDLVSGGFDIKNYESIPLTEEWLVKFGFGKNSTSYTNWKRPNHTKEVRLGIQNKFLFYNGLLINSVHQLQNLYFALTGEELIVKY